VAISEKPILEPEAPKPGIPLKRSTLFVLLGLLLGGGMLIPLFLSSSGATQPAAPAVIAKDSTELKQVGRTDTLADEEAQALRKLPRPAAPAPRQVASAVAVNPPLPPGVRRDDNTSALFDRSPASQASGGGATATAYASRGERAIEEEATARIAKALIHDSSDRSEAAPAPTEASRSAQQRVLDEQIATVQAPSTAISGQIEALKAQLGQQSARPGSWLREYAQESKQQGSVITGSVAPKGYVLRKGKIIPAVLGRQINSDLPGRIVAYVRENVYDAQGNLMIPMGSRLVGQYDSQVKVGQSRVLFAFEDLILPNGYSFRLPAAAGTDMAGAAGMTGDVRNHFFKMFGTSLLIAILADSTKQPSNVTNIGSSGPATAAGQVLTDVSRTVLDRNRVIPPTITVDQGTRINVEVVADMVFPAAYAAAR